MGEKRLNPYEYLRRECAQWARSVTDPKLVEMWIWDPSAVEKSADLYCLRERVFAARQLGFDVVVESDGKSITVKYRKRPPLAPWKIRGA